MLTPRDRRTDVVSPASLPSKAKQIEWLDANFAGSKEKGWLERALTKPEKRYFGLDDYLRNGGIRIEDRFEAICEGKDEASFASKVLAFDYVVSMMAWCSAATDANGQKWTEANGVDISEVSEWLLGDSLDKDIRGAIVGKTSICLLYTSPSPRD